MENDDSIYKGYVDLLESIIINSYFLKSAAATLIEKSIEMKDFDKRQAYIAYANNLLFAFIDEIGKYFLIKEQYPKNLKNISLLKLGFKDHDKKLEKLVSVIRAKQLISGKISLFSRKQTVQMLRSFKDSTLYIDYDDGKIRYPYDSLTLNRNTFMSYIDIVDNLEKMARYDFELFKMNPFEK